MKVRDLYPLITTTKLAAVKDFYVDHFGFAVAFNASWFLYLVGEGDQGARGAALAFMSPDHPSNPLGPETFDGRGMILTIEVADVSAAHDRLSMSGAPIIYPLTQEPWGQHRFMTRDPAGVLIDIVEQIEPDAGFWSQYMPK
ncbi:MAG: VOC family protein [Alphaproteobacteria bacterium]|nr:VOC family protein [Alphaproteobacteria bacterium]MBU0864880.1 VOC family protein [Alphaproteobacteria bacterium]MBU1825864.1 VOC family protein [Alphaproteobacteria bacterium]